MKSVTLTLRWEADGQPTKATNLNIEFKDGQSSRLIQILINNTPIMAREDGQDLMRHPTNRGALIPIDTSIDRTILVMRMPYPGDGAVTYVPINDNKAAAPVSPIKVAPRRMSGRQVGTSDVSKRLPAASAPPVKPRGRVSGRMPTPV